MAEYDILYEKLKDAGVLGYKQQHFEECKKIWQTQVPTIGESDSVQGEMLREIEKMRYEAVQNGNANWDDSYSFFCGNLYDLLSAANVLDEEKCETLRTVLDYLKLCGESGKVHTDFDVYDYVNDCIAAYSFAHPEPVPYEKKYGNR